MSIDVTGFPPGVSEDMQALAADIVGARIALRHTLAAVLLAIGKHGAINLPDLFALLQTLSAGYAFPKPGADAVEIKARAIAAQELAALEPTIRNMCTIPPGAGRA